MSFRLSTILLGAVILPVLMGTPAAHAEKKPVYTETFSNVAVQGYDPVAYFLQGAPVKGRKAFSTEFKGAEFRFATAENLERFKSDPDAYAPQYGGYCAYAVSQGAVAKGDAKYWSIVDGKLYLNYSGDVQKIWEADRSDFIDTADRNWPTVLQK